MEYDILRNEFIDHGENYLSSDPGLYGIFYTQYNESTMYSIAEAGSSLFMFDLKSLELQQIDTSIPESVRDLTCIASSELTNALYITSGDGGNDAIDSGQVFESDSKTWLTSIPSMNHARWYHGCWVEATNHKLYAIGGESVSQIESINIVNIQNHIWTVMDDELPVPLKCFGVTSVNGVIYIIGGFHDESASYMDTVHMIDTSTNTLHLDASILPYAARAMASIAADGIIYSFGGYSSSGSVDSWISYAVPTAAPSGAPSLAPTSAPSSPPTVRPTMIPTSEPSVYSTTAPYLSPTYEPTVRPTETPTGTYCGCDAEISSMKDSIMLLKDEIVKMNNILTNVQLENAPRSVADAQGGNVSAAYECSDGEGGAWGEINVTAKGLGMVVLTIVIVIIVIGMFIACKRSNGRTKVQPVAMGPEIVRFDP